MTKEDKFEIGLTLNKIAMLLSNDDFHKVKNLLKHIEQIIAEQSEADTPQTGKTCDNCGTPRDKCVYCIEEDRMWTPQTDCETCKHDKEEWYSDACDSCCKAHSNYEPQTDCAWK